MPRPCSVGPAQPYKSGLSKFWLKTKNVVESELILLGTDYDNAGKPIAYVGKEAGSELTLAGTAFLTLSGSARGKAAGPDSSAALSESLSPCA